jgi:hypothetical protein
VEDDRLARRDLDDGRVVPEQLERDLDVVDGVAVRVEEQRRPRAVRDADPGWAGRLVGPHRGAPAG